MKAILSVLVLAASSVAMTAPAKAADPCEQVLCPDESPNDFYQNH